MCEESQRRLGRIIARLQRRKEVQVPSSVTVHPTKGLIAWHHHQSGRCSGLRINVAGVMNLKSERHDLGWGASALNREPLIIGRALSGIKLVSLIGQVAVFAARSSHCREICASPRQMVIGNNGPLHPHFLQRRNHVFGEARFRRKIAVRLRRICAPEDLHLALLNEQFHLKSFRADERSQGVMVGEIHQVEARMATGSGPTPRHLIVLIPSRAISQLPGGCQTLHILDQRAGEAHLRAGIRVTQDTG